MLPSSPPWRPVGYSIGPYVVTSCGIVLALTDKYLNKAMHSHVINKLTHTLKSHT